METVSYLLKGFIQALQDFRRILRAIIGLAVFVAAPFGDTAARFGLWLKRRY